MEDDVLNTVHPTLEEEHDRITGGLNLPQQKRPFDEVWQEFSSRQSGNVEGWKGAFETFYKMI